MSHWYKQHTPVMQDSRRIRLYKGEFQVWRVTGFGIAIKNKIAEVVYYALKRDDVENGEELQSAYATMQALIKDNVLLNIGQDTKEQYIEKSKPKN